MPCVLMSFYGRPWDGVAQTYTNRCCYILCFHCNWFLCLVMEGMPFAYLQLKRLTGHRIMEAIASKFCYLLLKVPKVIHYPSWSTIVAGPIVVQVIVPEIALRSASLDKSTPPITIAGINSVSISNLSWSSAPSLPAIPVSLRNRLVERLDHILWSPHGIHIQQMCSIHMLEINWSL